jgi:hypothetical protein
MLSIRENTVFFIDCSGFSCTQKSEHPDMSISQSGYRPFSNFAGENNFKQKWAKDNSLCPFLCYYKQRLFTLVQL